MKPVYQFFTLLIAAILLTSCSSSNSPGSAISSERFLYTSTNDTSGNAIIQFNINADGSLIQRQTATFTGGNGDAADGDFDGQNSLIVVGQYLLAVNAGTDTASTASTAGNGSISVFEINTITGGLTRMDQNATIAGTNNIDSGGVRPVSLSYSNGRVLVANQHSNPHYPNTATTRTGTVIDSLGVATTIVDANTRNIVAFEFNNTTGVLSSPTAVATYMSGDWGGPSQVSFSPNGEKVAVTTWGVAQFGGVGETNAAVQRPSRIYFYDVVVTATTFTLTLTSTFEKQGLSGSIGFNWGSDNDRVFVANFNLATTDTATTGAEIGNHGATVISATATTGAATIFSDILSGSDPVPTNNATNEVCWTWLSGDRLYTSSFGSNNLSYFSVGSDTDSSLTHRASYERNGPVPGVSLPAGDSKDIFIARNGRLYIAGSFVSHTINVYEPGADGFYEEQTTSPYRVPFSIDNLDNTVANTEHAYLGLVGY